MENRLRQAGGNRPGTRQASWLAALLVLAGIGGCAMDRSNANDPLLGNGGRTTPPGTVPGGPGGPPPPPPISVAPSAPAVPSSTAALASGPAKPLDNGMRIGGDPGHPADSHATPPPPQAWGAVLQTPEPASGSMARAAPQSPITTPPPASPAHIAGSGSYEQAQEVLRNRGVTWQRLETWGDKGEWKFTCAIPNRQNPAIARNYEARANTPIDAIHAVLDKLDKEP